jgi:hypothetical protein
MIGLPWGAVYKEIACRAPSGHRRQPSSSKQYDTGENLSSLLYTQLLHTMHHTLHTQQMHSAKRPSSTDQEPPPKACKKQKINYPSGSQLPAAFWDGLTKLWLTSNALRELDRRNSLQSQQPSVSASRTDLQDIQELAREGGPDLSDLRGVGVYYGLLGETSTDLRSIQSLLWILADQISEYKSSVLEPLLRTN